MPNPIHTPPESTSGILRAGIGLLSCTACIVLWIAIVSHDPFDAPGRLAWPPNDPTQNACGPFGAVISHYIIHFLGVGAFALAAMVTVGAVMRLLRGGVSDWGMRAVGGLVVTLVTAGMATLLTMDVETGRIGNSGGVVGMAIVHFMLPQFSRAGTALMLFAALVIGVLIAADELMLRAWQGVLWIGRRVRIPRAAMHGRPQAGSAARTRADEIEATGTALSRTLAAISNTIGQFLRGKLAPVAAGLIRFEPREAEPPRVKRKPRTKAAPVATSEPFTDPSKEGATDGDDDGDTGEKDDTGDTGKAGDMLAGKAAVITDVADEPAEDSIATIPINYPSSTATVQIAEQTEENDESLEGSDDAADVEPSAAAPLPGSAQASPAHPPPIVRTMVTRRESGKATQSLFPKELGDYVLPPVDLLDEPEYSYVAAQESIVREKGETLERTLQEFRIDARVVAIDTGPVITMFEISLAPGIKVSQISSLSNDIARSLKAPAIRVVAPLPGKNTVGIEVPNVDKEKVRLKELITLSGVKPTKMAIPIFLGKDAQGAPLVADLAAMPHCLIAGTTGSGKSVCINTLIMSILLTQRPDHVKLILVDPKMVEMSVYKDVPHLMCPIVTDMSKAEMILQWATEKMDERYELLAEAGVRHVAAFNRLGKAEIFRRFNPSNDEEMTRIPTHLPYMVIIIDELADLMMTSSKQVEHHLCRIAQKSRAVGIHVVLATQRPQANVVTGLIKSNMPSRIAFRVASRMDSRIVLDQNGAEVLMGQGDMLFLPPGTSKLMRAQGTYIEDDELKRVLDDLRTKAAPEFHPELVKMRPPVGEGGEERDPLFDDAVEIVIETKRGSVSLLQRRLAIGYTRSSRLIDQMAFAGIVGEHKGSQQREVMVTLEEWRAIKAQRNREVERGNYEADKPAEDDSEAL